MAQLHSFSKENIFSASATLDQSAVLFGLFKKFTGFLLGAPSIGKTYLLLSIAYECASDLTLLGLKAKDKPQKVLYVAAEDRSDGLFTRAKEQIGAFDNQTLAQLEKNLSFYDLEYALLSANQHDLMAADSLNKLINAAKDYDLVIIDTIRKAIGTAREVQEDTFIDSMLTRLARESDVAVLCSHHLKKSQVNKSKSGKNSDMEGVDTTGGSGLSVTQSTSKFHLLLEKDDDSGELSLYHSKDNYVQRDAYISRQNKMVLCSDEFSVLKAITAGGGTRTDSADNANEAAIYAPIEYENKEVISDNYIPPAQTSSVTKTNTSEATPTQTPNKNKKLLDKVIAKNFSAVDVAVSQRAVKPKQTKNTVFKSIDDDDL